MEQAVAVAGATGDLGQRLIVALLSKKADVRAIVRPGGASGSRKRLQNLGVPIVEADYANAASLTAACSGCTCVVSVLSGLRDVVIDAQTALLRAAIEAKVARFIPSDFSIDFTRLTPGTNRNLDLRRDFHELLQGANIATTSIFNGAFTELLTGHAPIILSALKRVLYWGDADEPLDFTTKDDTAAYAAATALDGNTPRTLHIAGDRISARQLSETMSELSGERYQLMRGGSVHAVETLSRVTRALSPGSESSLYPPWQGMQYLHSMFGGLARQPALDNARYPEIVWTTARDVLAPTAR